MKIIVIENNYPGHNKALENPLYSTEEPAVYTLPDTALLKDHRPFFIPDFAHPCTLQTHLVVRICRLGRSISTRFAHRYYDAVTVGVTFTAENLLSELRAKAMPWELAKGFDGAAALGTFLPLENVAEGLGTSFSVKGGDTLFHSGKGCDVLRSVDEWIAEISQFYTLKQGDFLFTGCPAAPISVSPDTAVTGYIGEQKVLSFNIK